MCERHKNYDTYYIHFTVHITNNPFALEWLLVFFYDVLLQHSAVSIAFTLFDFDLENSFTL